MMAALPVWELRLESRVGRLHPCGENTWSQSQWRRSSLLCWVSLLSLTTPGPKEPEYKGQKLRKWVVRFANSNNGDQAREAMQALEEMGSNSVTVFAAVDGLSTTDLETKTL